MSLFVAALLLITLLGCRPQVKDTGNVKVLADGYSYFALLQFPDGSMRLFYACDGDYRLYENNVIRIRYTGDGRNAYECAHNVEIRTVQQQPPVPPATTIAGDAAAQETLWLTADHAQCGAVRHLDGLPWEAYAYNDMPRSHYFKTRDEAVSWLEKNWCRS